MAFDSVRGGLQHWLWGCGAALAALLTGYLLAVYGVFGAVLVLVLMLGPVFIFLSHRWWWVPIPACYALGGVLYFGFKIYLYELGVLLGVLPLFFAVGTKRAAVLQGRGPLPRVFLLLSAYLGVHLAFSLACARLYGEGGYGNILRYYVGGMWGVVFAILFHWFGSTRYLKLGLALFFAAYAFRVGSAILIRYVEAFAYIPGINYVLPGSTISGADDLRVSALGLATVAVGCWSLKRDRTVAAWLMSFIFGALVLVSVYGLLLGAGRTALGMFLLLPVMLLLFRRQFMLVGVTGALLLGAVTWLNIYPQSIDGLDLRLQRTLSILILKKGRVYGHELTEGSNYWHKRLRGMAVERWLDSPASAMFGSRVKRFDKSLQQVPVSGDLGFEQALQVAANVGSYETAWFSILAVTGGAGLGLFMWALGALLLRPFRYLLTQGVVDLRGVFCFLAIYNSVMWLITGWTYGGFPAAEMMLAAIANGACFDWQKQKALAQRDSEAKRAAVPACGGVLPPLAASPS